MTEKEIQKILNKVKNLDPCLRYWIFQDYIKSYNDLDFLKEEIDCEISKRKESKKDV